MSRIAHLFFETHMALGHVGLGLLLKKETKKPMLPGDTAIFINKSWTALKLMTSDEILIHFKRPKGINPAAIKYLPACVEGKELNYQKALESAVLTRFKKDNPRKESGS